MKQQPDTSTMEGRHAVERASETCRLQYASSECDSWGDAWRSFNRDSRFNWWDYDYRIHPDDLAKLPELEWTIENGHLKRNGCSIHFVGEMSKLTAFDILTSLNRPDQSDRVKELETVVARLRVELNNWEFRHVSEPYQPADECKACGGNSKEICPECSPLYQNQPADKWRPWNKEARKTLNSIKQQLEVGSDKVAFAFIHKLLTQIVDYLDGTPCGARKEGE